jgi:predicted Ser/Thr protein kinase
MDEHDPNSELDEVMEEYLARKRRGESPSTEEYAARHPALAGQIHALFPALEVVESSAARLLPDENTPAFPGLEILDAREAGIGGMGVVFRAREISLDRIVAVKTTLAHLDTPEGRAFFESEARAAAQLDHPHIVRVFSFHPDHEHPYYVMQFVEGRQLEQACRGRGARFTAEVLEKVARALFYAHDSGIVHRDIKPANILVDHENEPHIADFGLAKNLDAVLQARADAEATSLKGTPHYIAPELYGPEGVAAPTTDIYALGVTMYVLLTGRHPFAGASLDELRNAVRDSEPKLPKEIDPEIPEPLQRICLKAMERNPERRYASARMMADDLRRFREEREVFARPTRYLRERSGKLENHLTDIRLWHRQDLIDTREMDRLARPYHWLLEADSAWDELSRRFPWETALLRLGGWLAVVSSVLWLAFYWDDLVRWQRVTALAVPCVLVNLAGWMYHRRGSRLNAVVFLSTGSLLLPLLVAVALTEYGWLQVPQIADWELFGRAALEGETTDFVLTNIQASLTAGAFLFYAVTLLIVVRANLFGAWVGVGCYVFYSAFLLLLGLRFWLENEQVAWAMLSYLPVSTASSRSPLPSC